MEILEACKTLRHCNERFCMLQEPAVGSLEASMAVQALKSFLETVRADGKPIQELDIAEALLFTPEGMRWVMPFVISAEGMLAYQRRKEQR
jgi:hypothetical protein